MLCWYQECWEVFLHQLMTLFSKGCCSPFEYERVLLHVRVFPKMWINSCSAAALVLNLCKYTNISVQFLSPKQAAGQTCSSLSL